jgi:hypothetical protein
MARARKGPNPETGAGRPLRRQPNEGAGEDWLAEAFSDPMQETARLFAINLSSAIEKRYGTVSGRAAASNLGIDHQSLRKILSGISYPDLPFIVNVESRLDTKLWPDRRH